MWEDLTLKQKAEIMKMSVANGVTDIDNIRRLYNDSIIDDSNGGNVGMSGSSATPNNPIRPTEHRFNKGGQTTKKSQSAYQYGLIEQILRENGVNFRVTSGLRAPGAAGKAKNKSAHTYTLKDGSPAAIDIVPGSNSNWETLFTQMRSPQVQQALAAYGLDILNETDPVTMKKTGATGPHLHVGRGIHGQSGIGQIIGSGSFGGGVPSYGYSSMLNSTNNSSKIQQITLGDDTPQVNSWLQYLSTQNKPIVFNTPTKQVAQQSRNRLPEFISTDFSNLQSQQALNEITNTNPITAKKIIESGLGLENNALWNSPYLLFNNSNNYLV